MSEHDILNWIGAVASVSILVFILLFLIIVFSLNYKNKSKVKKTLCSNDFNKLIGTEKQLTIGIDKYFQEIFIKDVDRTLFKKLFKTETGFGKRPTKIAWDFFIILITSVLANTSEGKVSEAVNSLKNIFDESKKLLLSSSNGNLITDIILKIINLKIRPILVNSRLLAKKDANDNFTINDENLDENTIKDFWNQVNKLRKELVENKYLYFISVLSLSGHTNEQINNLVSYPNEHKITENKID
ncbi:hypothetical protein [Spiroplasma endosymbiont of Virgichneumon dumeticola]|uniref:hypothetical protein n=1 Tax=Spiroplasma endosymbiont of Virgichneumon dumeticola TaxID=3139323 RepID=UPI0035C88B39